MTKEKVGRPCKRCGKEKKDMIHSYSRDGVKFYSIGCNACKREVQKKYREQNKRKIHLLKRSHLLRSLYGMTHDDWEKMAAEQGFVCAICGLEETQLRRGAKMSLSVDHCHSSGKIRALLCNACNNMLGNARDNPLTLEAAAAYLRRFQDSPGGHSAPPPLEAL